MGALNSPDNYGGVVVSHVHYRNRLLRCMAKFGESISILSMAGALAGQPPPPGRGSGSIPPGGPDGVRRKLAEIRSTGPATVKLLSLSRAYLERSECNESRNEFASTRYLAAADAVTA